MGESDGQVILKSNLLLFLFLSICLFVFFLVLQIACWGNQKARPAGESYFKLKSVALVSFCLFSNANSQLGESEGQEKVKSLGRKLNLTKISFQVSFLGRPLIEVLILRWGAWKVWISLRFNRSSYCDSGQAIQCEFLFESIDPHIGRSLIEIVILWGGCIESGRCLRALLIGSSADNVTMNSQYKHKYKWIVNTNTNADTNE